jgi:hypothetical protein
MTIVISSLKLMFMKCIMIRKETNKYIISGIWVFIVAVELRTVLKYCTYF